jgi:8-oxo-dGTP pyrophosphatase MutT (NUDIX family)
MPSWTKILQDRVLPRPDKKNGRNGPLRTGTDVKRSPALSFQPVTGCEPRTQCAALCWRRAQDQVEVLLVTSRETGRWVIPKGWPIDGLPETEGAAREAWEEAGVRGEIGTECLGVYSYDKVLDRDSDEPQAVPCVVAVYPMQVTTLRKSFPEASERRTKWFPQDKAARKVIEPELAALIAAFRPDAGDAPA